MEAIRIKRCRRGTIGRHARLLGMALTALLLGGCANMNSIHRRLDLSKGDGALIDIKQRAILVSSATNHETRVCAEPSPDALSAYAAQMAAKLE